MLSFAKSIRSSHSIDGSILLDWERGRMFSLNSIAARIVALLNDDPDEDRAAEVISREYDVELSTAKEDIRSFLEQLREHGLIAETCVGGQS